MLTNLKTLLAAGAVAAALAANANAAGYINFDGVDGEAKAACAEQPQTQTTNYRRAAQRAAQNDDAQCATAYGKDGKKGGNVEFEWKTEEGES